MIGRITAIAIVLFVVAPGAIYADSPLDFTIEEGHFYAEAAGSSSPTGLKGYIIENNDDALMLDGFERLGGVSALGYPISRRFNWHNRITQVTQRAILQWDNQQKKVVIASIFDDFSSLGLDEQLHNKDSIPRRIVTVAADQSQNQDDLANARMALLDGDPVIKAAYQSTPFAPELYGLPTSGPEEFGAFVAMRFQRAVLQHWKIDTSFAHVGDVTSVNAGQLAEDLGIITGANWDPEDAPNSDGQRAMLSTRGSDRATRGVATWYGADFQGRPMRDGQLYNMNDSTITACNTYPLGTRLRVTRLATGKSIVVTVTDTGAFRYPIVVDLSWAAFGQLADPDDGVISVSVEPLRD